MVLRWRRSRSPLWTAFRGRVSNVLWACARGRLGDRAARALGACTATAGCWWRAAAWVGPYRRGAPGRDPAPLAIRCSRTRWPAGRSRYAGRRAARRAVGHVVAVGRRRPRPRVRPPRAGQPARARATRHLALSSNSQARRVASRPMLDVHTVERRRRASVPRWPGCAPWPSCSSARCPRRCGGARGGPAGLVEGRPAAALVPRPGPRRGRRRRARRALDFGHVRGRRPAGG